MGAVNKYPGMDLKIIPVGMNYFHAHKFRSRAVIEFGTPIEVPAELAKKMEDPNQKRAAIGEMLETIREGLEAVTVTTPDYDTLMVIPPYRLKICILTLSVADPGRPPAL
jgi:glycerol-3-phosphate O-acyltransferase/dihydroxyacetone phosphate acyltransferase